MSGQFSSDPMLDMFIFETTQNMEQLEQTIISSEKSSSFSKEAINEIFRIMHTIKGSSAIMAFSGISSLAHKAEDLFFYIREQQPREYDTTLISDLILESIDFIGAELEKIKNGEQPTTEAKDLMEKMKVELDVLKSGGKPASAAKVSQTQNTDLSTAAAPDDAKRWSVMFFFEDGCEMENIRAFNLVFNLQNIAQELAYFPEDISNGELSIDIIKQNGFLIFFKSTKNYDELYNFFNHSVFMKDFELAEYESADEFEKDKREKLSLPAAEKEEAGKTEEVAAASTATAAAKENTNHATQSFINVNVAKLDSLMDLIGELVIAEAMVEQNPDLQGLSLDNFGKAAHQLRKITSELQGLAMSVRMVPLTNTFQKMNRIVRDMSKKLGKEVQLKIVGDDTEVDKSIIDHISDPLMHLVRNSLDHGIETAEDRVKNGKPAIGTVLLEARNEGGEVLIFVKDDGKGLSKAKILKKCKENGLLTKPENEMTDKEIYSMIFLPGFSTKENITEFSGRGVGMDVVVKNIETLGGRVFVDSKEGFGTQTTIRFPLTLAIINGMNVKVGESKYTIPITAVRELIKPKEVDIITDPDRNEMIMYRGKCYSIVRLNKFYDISTELKKFDDGMLIMAEDGDRMIGLFADELIGENQVVIKPLPKYIKKIDGVAGCTILGDGSISLILDVGGLISANQFVS